MRKCVLEREKVNGRPLCVLGKETLCKLGTNVEAHEHCAPDCSWVDSDQYVYLRAVHVHGIHSLPDFVNLDFGECDPTVFMQLGGQRSSTNSLRFQRAPGTEPCWNQAFSFKNVASADATAAGARNPGAGAGSAPHGLQMVVCEVDSFGQLDYILGQANLPLASLLRARRLVGDLPLAGVRVCEYDWRLLQHWFVTSRI